MTNIDASLMVITEHSLADWTRTHNEFGTMEPSIT